MIVASATSAIVDDRAHLVGREDVEAALLALGVGVLGRGDAAAVPAEVAQHVADGLGHHLAVPVVAGHLPAVRVEPDEARLVVQHLLEVGDQPVRVDGVAGEPAAEVVVHAARGHRVEGRLDHRPGDGRAAAGDGPDHEVHVLRRRELRGAAEAAPGVVVVRLEPLGGGLQHLGTRHVVGRLHLPALAERPGELGGLGGEVVAAVLPGVVDRLEHLHEGRHAAVALLRVVRAPVERLARWGEEHRHRPTATPGHGLDGVHVDGVDVGPLLPVDLHVDEQPVHDRSRLSVLEALVRHDVAPVAGRVADREQHRHVLVSRAASNASGPHGYQSTGLSACWRRYGLDSAPKRFTDAR